VLFYFSSFSNLIGPLLVCAVQLISLSTTTPWLYRGVLLVILPILITDVVDSYLYKEVLKDYVFMCFFISLIAFVIFYYFVYFIVYDS